MSIRKYETTKRGHTTTQYTVDIHSSELLQFVLLRHIPMSATDMESVQLRSEFVEYMSSLPNFMRYKQFFR